MSEWRYGVRLLLRRPVIVLSILAIMVLINILVITAGRGLVTSYEGRAQFANLEQDDIYTLNLDPGSDYLAINDEPQAVDEVIDELVSKKNFAITVGMNLPEGSELAGVDTRIQYVNKAYTDLVPLELAAGAIEQYTEKANPGDDIPVIVGYGLGSRIPIGARWEVVDPGSGQKVTYRVSGILNKDFSVSNLYSLDSKIYYNYSIILPIEDKFLTGASIDFKLNALFDTILLNETLEGAKNFARFVDDKINIKLNVFTQAQNSRDFFEHVESAMRAIGIFLFICLLALVPIVLWMSSQFIKLTIKDITINLLTGMSYRALDRLIFSSFMAISFASLILTILYLIGGRVGNRSQSSADLYTYGAWGLLPMDWIALLVATGFNLLVSIALCSLVSFRVRRVPISIGVLS